MRIAIIGFGPKGLHALERLLDHATAIPRRASLEIDLFEPDPNPGAGPNYAPDQPGYLRMNVAADQIDLWWPDSLAVPRSVQRSFARWRAGTDTYPSRSEVGCYLSDGFESLLRHAPRAATIRLHATEVDAVRANGVAWDVEAGGSLAGTYDEVLIATGHVQTSPTGLAAGWRHAAPLVPRVFPVERHLTPETVPGGSVVAIRGFGLSFIDAALALTVGRGGSFRPTGHPFRLAYSPSPDDPLRILPFSRTGRSMLAKPDHDLATRVPELAEIARRGRDQVVALADEVDLFHDLLPILAASAGVCLEAASGDHDENPDAWFANAAAGFGDEGTDPAGAIARSLAVGAGLEPPGLAWAVGHVWRSLYPAIVHRLGDGGLLEGDWPAFHRLAAELERVAFGPSPLNAARLLALIEAGVVDLSLVGGAELRDRNGRTYLSRPGAEHALDVVVDAVLPGPGVLPAQSALIDGLLADGCARVAGARRGLDVEPDGSCRASDGSPSLGLAAIGRPTEDVVIGNDTLGRSLHPLSDRWARRVVQRCLDASARELVH